MNGASRMRGWIGLGLILALLPLAASATSVGELAPPLALQSAEGKWQRLQDYRGRVVYVDFWASWCAPCREALPQLDRLSRQWNSRGFTVLAVNVDTEREAALAMLQQMPLSMPILFDPAGVWPERFNLPGMPTGYLIGRNGVVRQVHKGYHSKDLPEMEQQITQLLDQKKK